MPHRCRAKRSRNSSRAISTITFVTTPRTPELERRTIDVFIRSFDPSQSALLESEVEDLRVRLASLFKRVDDGDCAVLETVRELFVKRQREVAKFVKEVVSPEDYQIDPAVELIIDAQETRLPKDRGRSRRLDAQSHTLPDVELRQ